MIHRLKYTFLSFCVLLACSITSHAQLTRTVKFDTRDKGERKAITHWGIDATWINFYNAKASLKHAGKQIDYIRIGFYLHEKTNDDGSLSKGQTKMLDKALQFVDMVDKRTPIMLSPHNEHGIIDWYKEKDGSANIKRWYNVMLKTKEYVESKGYRVVLLEVFNEPDWKNWNMGKKEDFNELFKMCEDWNIVRIGPSTLSTNSVQSWHDSIHKNIDAGSTHTINGHMEQYIDYIKKLQRKRMPFMNPEVHSLVEVIVGAELGIDSVCWWDQINQARGMFMKACQGTRIAYEQVTDNWSAGCIYRGPDGILYGFASTNERGNGKETKYKFICEDQDVTYYPEGNSKKGVFVQRGEPFETQAKVTDKNKSKRENKKTITKWFTIIPAKK